MQTTLPRGFPLFVFLTVFGFNVAGVSAVNVAEGPDFPNITPGPATVLDLGTNVFSGTISTPSDGQDRFDVTVPAGRRITQVTKTFAANNSPSGANVVFNTEDLGGTGSGTFVNNYPLGPGTYSALVGASFAVGNAWTVTFIVGAIPDYTVSTTGNTITVTDTSGNSDTLDVTQPASGQIRFAAPGRSFSVNGAAPITGNSGDLSLASVTMITVSANAGADTINVGAFAGSSFPELQIQGGSSTDTVNLNGDISFGADKFLDVFSETMTVAANANLITSGTGGMFIDCSRNIVLNSGSSLETTNGDLTIKANQQTTAMTGDFKGLELNGATLRSNGTGNVTALGRGGNDAANGIQLGISLFNAAKIIGGSGYVDVIGTGGASTNWINRGVTVNGVGTEITSTSGEVNVIGTGGASSSQFGIGVSVLNGGVIRAGATGKVTVTGTGASSGVGGSHQGVEIGGAGSRVHSAGGNVDINGVAGSGSSFGILAADSAEISTPIVGGSVTFESDSISIGATATITSAGPASSVTLATRTATTRLDLGGVDDTSGSPKVLGLTDTELDRVTTPQLVLFSAGNAAIVINQPISPANAANLTLDPNSTTGSINANALGTDITLPSGGIITVDGPLVVPITSTTPDSGFPQLNVSAAVNLANRSLDLTGTTLVGAPGDTFVIIENDDTDPINGTFTGLPEGSTLAWPGSSSLVARISYSGGSGNDVVLTLIDPLMVTSHADSGSGSLRDVIAFASSKLGPDNVTFSSDLSGQTIVLDSELTISDAAGVTVDASNLPAGITLTDTGMVNHRLVRINGGIATLRSLSLVNGGSSSFSNNGGALRNDGGILTLERCTFSGNSAQSGGAIFSSTNSDFTASSTQITQCTFSGNTASDLGGAIRNQNGRTTLRHCTLSGNTAPAANGSGVASFGDSQTQTVVRYSIIAGNANSDVDFILGMDNSFLSQGHNLIGSGNATANFNQSGDQVNPANINLAPLAHYGGPTQTMSLKPGSIARNAAAGSTITSDQRNFLIIDVPDIGAYEAGTTSNFNAWICESLPATATAPQYAATFDFDGDGQNNLHEYGTLGNPVIPNAPRNLVFTRDPAGALATLVTPYRPGATDLEYAIERSTNLTGWTTIVKYTAAASNIQPIPGVSYVSSTADTDTYTDTFMNGQPKTFYRLSMKITAP